MDIEPESMIGEEIFDTKEVCTFLKITRVKLYRMITKGQIKAFNVGGGATKNYYRFRKSDILAFISTPATHDATPVQGVPKEHTE